MGEGGVGRGRTDEGEVSGRGERGREEEAGGEVVGGLSV